MTVSGESVRLATASAMSPPSLSSAKLRRRANRGWFREYGSERGSIGVEKKLETERGRSAVQVQRSRCPVEKAISESIQFIDAKTQFARQNWLVHPKSTFLSSPPRIQTHDTSLHSWYYVLMWHWRFRCPSPTDQMGRADAISRRKRYKQGLLLDTKTEFGMWICDVFAGLADVKLVGRRWHRTSLKEKNITTKKRRRASQKRTAAWKSK